MNDFTDTPPLSWETTTAWLVDSLRDVPTAFVLDLGPRSYVAYDDEDEEVVCAQVQALADGVLMVRRSRRVLDRLLLGDYSVENLELDRWHFGGHFEDCTDGYLFTRDVRLIAEICVTWFGENPTTGEMGCSYEFPDVLMPEEVEMSEEASDNGRRTVLYSGGGPADPISLEPHRVSIRANETEAGIEITVSDSAQYPVDDLFQSYRIAPADVPALRDALGGTADEDAVALMKRRIDDGTIRIPDEDGDWTQAQSFPRDWLQKHKVAYNGSHKRWEN
jgi:hypothetical protein